MKKFAHIPAKSLLLSQTFYFTLHRSQAAKLVLRCALLRYIICLNFCTHFAINATVHRNISIEFLQFKVLILLRLCYAQTVAKSNFSPELFRSLILLVMFIEKVCSYSCEKPVAFANFLFYFASFTISKSGIALCWAQVYYLLHYRCRKFIPSHLTSSARCRSTPLYAQRKKKTTCCKSLENQ